MMSGKKFDLIVTSDRHVNLMVTDTNKDVKYIFTSAKTPNDTILANQYLGYLLIFSTKFEPIGKSGNRVTGMLLDEEISYTFDNDEINVVDNFI